MPLQTSGQISISNIMGEVPSLGSNVSLYSLSTSNLINLQSPFRPDKNPPHAMSEFYGYDQNFSAGVDMSMYLSNDIYTMESYLEVTINGSMYYAYSYNPYPEYNILVDPGSTVDMRIIASDGQFTDGVAADWFTNRQDGSSYGDYMTEINTTFVADDSEFELYVNAFSTGPVGGDGGLKPRPVEGDPNDPFVGR